MLNTGWEGSVERTWNLCPFPFLSFTWLSLSGILCSKLSKMSVSLTSVSCPSKLVKHEERTVGALT